jgi:hypothetical protein
MFSNQINQSPTPNLIAPFGASSAFENQWNVFNITKATVASVNSQEKIYLDSYPKLNVDKSYFFCRSL